MKIVPDYLNGWKLVPDEEVELFSGTNINIKTTFTDDTCKNVGKDCSETDQFVCSKCGIELLDWTRYIGDECYEYAFKFCPNCGRKIVEGSEEDELEDKQIN